MPSQDARLPAEGIPLPHFCLPAPNNLGLRIIPADGFAPQRSFRDVVVERQPTVLEEASQRALLVERVGQRCSDRRAIERDLGLSFAPPEEGVDDGRRELTPHRLTSSPGRLRQLLLDLEELADHPQRLFRQLGLGPQRLEEIAAPMGPAGDLSDPTASVEVIVDDVSVGDEVAFIAGEETTLLMGSPTAALPCFDSRREHHRGL